MVLADDSEIRFSASQLIDEYYADDVTLEQYIDTADGNKKKFRITTSYKNKVDGAEQVSNKTASVTSASTATQYPSALAVWNSIKNFATSVQTFTTASTRENIESGETISEIFGKVRKWIADLKDVAFSGSYNDLSEIPSDIVKAKSPITYQGTIEELWIELSGKTGSMGSVYLKPSASGAGSIISETWYNYIHIPHRTGIGADNHLYAHILLFPMVKLGIANLDVSISNGSIFGIKKFSDFQFSDISGSIGMDRVANLTSALNQKLTKNIGWFVSNQSIPYWYKIAEYICYEEWFDLNSTFIASKNFYGTQGILVSSIRTNYSGTVEVCNLDSMVYEDAFSPANFAIAYKETKGSNVVFQIWGKCPAIYNGGSIMLLYNGVRSKTPQNQSDYWNFFTQTEVSTNKVAVNSDGSFTLPGFTVKICGIANINNFNATYRKLKDVLEITDSNLATYYNSGTEVMSGISNTIGTILINCSSMIKISAIQMTDVFNGKRVSLIGEFVPSERYSSYNNTVSGGFSSYLYAHRPGSPNSSLTNDTVIRGYEDFIYFNGKWYGKGY
jgi:hypothetical protein